MKFSYTLGAALCAGAALAAPGSKTQHKLKNVGQPSPMKKVSVPAGKSDAEADSYSSNWSGASINPSSGDTITSVQATFTVPTPSVPSGDAAGSYSGAAWIGIDGTESGASLWQAGAIWTVDNSGGSNDYTYGVWYEWLPNGLVVLDNFPVNAGDVIYVNLTSQSSTTGTVVITDQTSGQSSTVTTSAPSATDTLIGQSAEWITEDFSSGGGLVPFADYGSVSYTGCAWGSVNGGGDLTGGTVIDLTDSSGNVVSQGAISGSSEVDTTYQ